jgi:hypothetical protein
LFGRDTPSLPFPSPAPHHRLLQPDRNDKKEQTTQSDLFATAADIELGQPSVRRTRGCRLDRVNEGNSFCEFAEQSLSGCLIVIAIGVVGKRPLLCEECPISLVWYQNFIANGLK